MTEREEIERLRMAAKIDQIAVDKLMSKIEVLVAALKPFAELAGKLDGAPNLIGLLTEEDFKRAAKAFGDEQPVPYRPWEKLKAPER